MQELLQSVQRQIATQQQEVVAFAVQVSGGASKVSILYRGAGHTSACEAKPSNSPSSAGSFALNEVHQLSGLHAEENDANHDHDKHGHAAHDSVRGHITVPTHTRTHTSHL